MTPLFLASRSPRRRELLAEAGIPFILLDVSVDEHVPRDIPPERAARELAEEKALAGSRIVSEGLVLGADTLVAVSDEILGKPRDRADARRMLAALSGTTHRVVTGIALVDARTGALRSAVDVTQVTMRPLSESEIESYVESGEGDDKAGAYAIQENADRFVVRLDGSWSNVVGLPIERLLSLLGELGLR